MEHDQNNISLPQYTTISSQHPHAYAYHHQNTRDAHGPSFVQPLIVDETKHYEDALPGELESEDETLHEDPKQNQNTMFHASPTKKPTKKTRGRVKIKMEFIQNKLRRYTTFSKRKTGIMKKAYELSTLTGTQVMLLVASETGHVYTFATRKLQPMITSESGKALIQTCLNSPDPAPTLPTQVQVVPPPSVEHTIPSPPIIEPRHSDEVPVNYTTQEHESKAAATSEIEYTSGQSANQSAAYKPSKQQLSNYTTILSPAITKSHSPSHHNQPQILSGQLQVHRIHPQNIILTGNSPILHTGNVVVNTTSAAHLERVHQSTSSATNVLTLVNQSQPQRSNVQWVYNNEQVIYASPTQKINDNSRPPVIQSQSDGQLLNEATILVRK